MITMIIRTITTTITVIHILHVRTLILLPHIQMRIHTHEIPIPILIRTLIRTPLRLLRSKHLRGDTSMYQLLAIPLILNLPHVLNLLSSTLTWMGITRPRILIHTHTRQRQTG